MFIAILIALFVIVCTLLILVILLQAGRGEGLGVTFGGTSQTIFGARGASDFLSKATAYLAIGYLILALLLSKFYQRTESGKLTTPKEPAQTQTKTDNKSKPATTTSPSATPSSVPKPTAPSSPKSNK
jgi:preprotein translocase subunit SecG